MSHKTRFIRELSFASMGFIAVQLAGFISFPIWTRIFSVQDYGLISLITVTVSILSSISKFGLQHSATRYYSVFKENKYAKDISCYYTTILLGTIFFCIIIYFMGNLLLPRITFLSFHNLSTSIILLIGLLAFTGGLIQLLIAFLFVEEKAKLVSISRIVTRYGQFIFSLIFVAFFAWGLSGFLLGQFFVQAFVLLILLLPFFTHRKFQASKFSFTFLFDSLKYGMPLLAFELVRTFLSLGDRYLIDYFLGPEQVGFYSAAYNLCMYASAFFAPALQNVVSPIYLEIWQKEGKEATESFLSIVLNYYFLLTIPIFFAFIPLNKDILTLVASSKYAASSSVIPIIIPSLILGDVYFIFGAGLYIEKKTLLLLEIIGISILLNISLNIILIPLIQITGAAMATFIANIFFIFCLYYSSRKIVKIKIDILVATKYTIASLPMLAFLFAFTGPIIYLIPRIVVGSVLYFMTLYLIDRNFSDLVNRYTIAKAIAEFRRH